MSTLFKVKRLMKVNTWLIGISTALLTGLVMLLSLKLRHGEMETMFKIGCERKMTATIQLTELGIILAFGLGVAIACAFWLDRFATRGLENWIAGQ